MFLLHMHICVKLRMHAPDMWGFSPRAPNVIHKESRRIMGLTQTAVPPHYKALTIYTVD